MAHVNDIERERITKRLYIASLVIVSLILLGLIIFMVFTPKKQSVSSSSYTSSSSMITSPSSNTW